MIFLIDTIHPAVCLTPILINHARNPNDGVYRLNDRVEYSCYPGYQAKGVPEAVCKLFNHNQTHWTWSGQKFKCTRKFGNQTLALIEYPIDHNSD